ncbi:glycoside hydrolase N-terminal domain-containing protein [Carboxylicivirga mesophila]|uniref:Glycoside hydrolase N-terminal domain-containing protein n=1 Tax=Carboxylicivirga mesophila TaxID=1166478 RepID=A0ABS5KC96_9BACT|nr:glycoside hydrolase N-terminal domain-containing protein [Carboxylicivirga mesophila]MBS2212664.1 glycoside hydrolase N-terminal domain-containing protein [Carboxylicivirga mesophila]
MNLNVRMAIVLVMFNVIVFGQNHRDFNGAITSQPAQRWEEAMLTGNGNMGAMMYGNPVNETIVINHCQLFLTLGTKEFVQDLSGAMPEIKKAALDAGRDGPAVVHEMMREMSGQKIKWTDPFHPAFTFHIDADNQNGAITDYQLSEDFTNGELCASWKNEEGKWLRKMFISRTDNVVVMEISGPKGKVGGSFSMKMGHELIDVDMHTSNGEIASHVTYVNGKGGYDNLVRIIPAGGIMSSDGNAIKVKGADKLTILMQVEPWRAPLPETQSEVWAFSPKHPDFINGYSKNKLEAIAKNLDKLAVDYNSLFASHALVHNDLFSRVRLKLDNGSEKQITTQEMLKKAAQDGSLSPALVEKLYDACRYLIICSTGTNPANLQGIWTGTWQPEWSGDYTLDSNIQLEIQSLMSCNMTELMESYFRLIESWLVDSRLNAQKLFGCRGIVSNPRASNTNLFIHWGRWPGEQSIGTMGWMLHFFYDYYRFTGDKDFLKNRVVPILKENVLFYEDLLKDTEDENGKYTFWISYSPEQDHLLYANSTFDISVLKSVLSNLIQACEILDIEAENIPEWTAMLNKLPDYQINDKGELKEWAYEGTQENYNQRHHSHLLPLYQFCEFDKESDPVLWAASEKAFEGKEKGFLNNWKNPDSNHITHGLMNQAQCAARLRRADVVNEVLSRLVCKKYVYPSFMISYWPDNKGYGFDPVGTIPDVINNSLIFAWDGKLDILPALPEGWEKGSLEKVLLRGQLQVEELKWDVKKEQVNLKITSKVEQAIEVHLPKRFKKIVINGKTYSHSSEKLMLKL